MPTYDYVCEACGHEFEHFQSMTDRHLRTCPKCKKKKLMRKVGAGAGLIFKGSGFYITDYPKSGSSGGEKGGERGGEKGGGKKPDEKSGEKTGDMGGDKGGGDSKPAEKPAEGSALKKESPAAKTDSKPIGPAKKDKGS